MSDPQFAIIDGNTNYPVKPPDSTTDQSSNFVTPYKIATGTQRGTQGVGFSGPKIDSANNRITVGGITLDGNTTTITTTNSDGSINGQGLIPDGSGNTGFFSVDATGKIIWKLVKGTQYFYNPVDNYNNSIILGFAPTDHRSGLWVAKLGQVALTLLGG